MEKYRKNILVAPVLKWAGGKRQLLDVLVPLLPKRITTYCEPFVGGGALLFKIQPKRAYVNDINTELINVYRVIKTDVEKLINDLSKHENTADYFYALRNLDRDKDNYETLSDIQRASRILYLNKTCYNGLYRVNNAGEFNAPYGYYRNPNIINAPVLRAVSLYLNSNDVTLSDVDYKEVLKKIRKGTFVYIDPPYDPVSDTANFTGYVRGGFSHEEQISLRECCDELDRRGIKFMVSNSATKFIKQQYKNYNITKVKAKRTINSNPNRRGDIDEVVIRNYE
jgi:DNA adenine methylase